MAKSSAERVAAMRERQKISKARDAGEEAYVAKMMLLPTIVGPDGLENAQKRQEEYARWRWAGVQSGEVGTL